MADLGNVKVIPDKNHKVRTQEKIYVASFAPTKYHQSKQVT
jgi:hypothetical protein